MQFRVNRIHPNSFYPGGFKMQTEKLTSMMAFQKQAFDAAFDTMSRIQDQTVNSTQSMLENVMALPQAGVKSLEGWIDLNKKAQGSMKSLMDESYAAWSEMVTDTFDKAKNK
jgi:hypothetical protein